MTIEERMRRGENSMLIAQASGIRPPSGSPSKKRSTSSASKLEAVAVAVVSRPNATAHRMMAGRRPIRSAM
ncbi:MAG TPA: hypothetical protein VE046_16445 [Steroidobacteraceae bacterium]|nr:hypothetical protein [Steroidobacteraceae bacterium]